MGSGILFKGNDVINFGGAPGILIDVIANQPATAQQGTIFIASDTLTQYIYNAGSWQIISGGGGGSVNIYNTDGTLTGARTLDGGGFDLLFNNLNSFEVYDIFGNNLALNSKQASLSGASGATLLMDISGLTNFSDGLGNNLTFNNGASLQSVGGGVLINDSVGNNGIDVNGFGGIEIITFAGQGLDLSLAGDVSINTDSGIAGDVWTSQGAGMPPIYSGVPLQNVLNANSNADLSTVPGNFISIVDTVNAPGDQINIYANGIILSNAGISTTLNYSGIETPGFILVNSSNGFTGAFDSGNISSSRSLFYPDSNITDPTIAVNVNYNGSDFNADSAGNVTLLNNSTAAPGTNPIVSLPANVYGTVGTLLGEPADWMFAVVNGVNRAIPCY